LPDLHSAALLGQSAALWDSEPHEKQKKCSWQNALAINHLQAGGEWASEAPEELSDPAMEDEECLDLNNLTVTDLSEGPAGRGLECPRRCC